MTSTYSCTAIPRSMSSPVRHNRAYYSSPNMADSSDSVYHAPILFVLLKNSTFTSLNRLFPHRSPYFITYYRTSNRPLSNYPPIYPTGIHLTDEEILHFQAIYKHETGSSIDINTARDKATKLMTYVHVLLRYGNMPQEEQAYE
jgi:hypothetical protein